MEWIEVLALVRFHPDLLFTPDVGLSVYSSTWIHDAGRVITAP